MNFSNHLFRCSQLSKLMTPPKDKEDKAAGRLGQTAITYLRELHRELKYNRRNEYSSKYIEKGLTQEENAITLLSRVKKQFFTKNKERLFNQYITGEPDLFKGASIHQAEEGWDTKCSWDVFTFPYPADPLNKAYEWQDHGYMALTGAKKWTTSYCLVNAPGNLITQEKKNTWFKMDCPDESNEEYVRRCCEIEKNMIFNIGEFLEENPGYDLTVKDWHYDIPLKERVLEFAVYRDEEKIKSIYSMVAKCREYLNAIEPPSAILATHDEQVNATIIEPINILSKLKKIS